MGEEMAVAEEVEQADVEAAAAAADTQKGTCWFGMISKCNI